MYNVPPAQKVRSRRPKKKIDLYQGWYVILGHKDQLIRCITCSQYQVESETHFSTKQSSEVVDAVHVKTLDATCVVATTRSVLCQTNIVGNMPTFIPAVAKSLQMRSACTYMIMPSVKKRWTRTFISGASIKPFCVRAQRPNP